MPKREIPLVCPSCGEEGSLFVEGNEYLCRDPLCGQAFPVNPKYGLQGPPKKTSKTTKTVKSK